MDGRDAMLAVAMNGSRCRSRTASRSGWSCPACTATCRRPSGSTDIELTTFDAFDAYWIQRGWAQQAPIKTESRIDTPTRRLARGGRPGPGRRGGLGAARRASTPSRSGSTTARGSRPTLAGEDTIDTWRQWVYRWQAAPGDHQVSVRATDRTGFTQGSHRAEPFPNGAEGQHTVTVRVTWKRHEAVARRATRGGTMHHTFDPHAGDPARAGRGRAPRPGGHGVRR